MSSNDIVGQIDKSRYESAEILKEKMLGLVNDTDQAEWILSLSNLLADEIADIKVRTNLIAASITSESPVPQFIPGVTKQTKNKKQAAHIFVGESIIGRGWNESESAPGMNKYYRWTAEKSADLFIDLAKGIYSIEIKLFAVKNINNLRIFVNGKEYEYSSVKGGILIGNVQHNTESSMELSIVYPVRRASEKDARVIGCAVSEVIVYPYSNYNNREIKAWTEQKKGIDKVRMENEAKQIATKKYATSVESA